MGKKKDELICVEPSQVPLLVAAYVQAYQKRYGANTRPDIRGKVLGQMKTFLKDYPIERACQLIQVYCQVDDPWFKTKCYDFGTFLENLNKVSLALDTGQDQSAAKINWNWGTGKHELQ